MSATPGVGPTAAATPLPASALAAPSAAATGTALGWVKDFALALLLALFVLVFLFQPFRVEGVSMMPQFSDRDRIIVNKLSYRLGDIHRGDVVVFWFPE